ncbi:hypothetical protein [Tessaracoccus oleiagri]|uniref:PknH-like extracellular domain-containing protein n=1 Tax=Tessaracoccus oleiagri TaxID=686624 RepID=A0A1G9JLQ0_9ACTN|nr:hypothetical protein [Tessaracoccus oleiagri]SDL38232.1 hypothetical protein SAMN04488242_1327 [Tessaracoccus oleiagri]
MSDDAVRPRRAFGSDDSAHDSEPTPGHSPIDATEAAEATSPFARPGSGGARRSADEPDDGEPSGEGAARGPDFDPTERFDMPRRFARPSETLIPAPVLPGRAEGFYDGPGPRPRRSALSSNTPPEPPPAAPPGQEPLWPASPQGEAREADATKPEPSPVEPSPAAAGPGDGSPGSPVSPTTPPVAAGDRGSWWTAHARSFVIAGLGVALMAVGAGVVGYYSAPTSEPSVSASPSPGVSQSTMPRVTQADLLTEADAKALDANATWAITNTTTSVEEHTARAACFSTEVSSTERLSSLQRTLGSTQDNQLAVLHQLDAYPTEEAAKEAMTARRAIIADCSEVPSRIMSSDNVAGLADEAYQVTVLYENQQPQYHNLLLTRVGNILSMTDAFSNGQAVPTTSVVEAVKRSTDSLRSSVGQGLAGAVEVTAGVVPPADPVGWLIPADLPRMRAGVGRWTAQQPAALTSRGNGCENLTLATAAGPTERLQNTYLMTQDDQRPDQFGLDEMVFTLADDATAGLFAKTIADNIASCGDRVLGTEVSAIDAGNGIRAYNLRRETGNGAIAYQVALVPQGNKVAYLMATVTDGYRFTDANLAWVAQRARVRLTQS